MNAVMDVTYVDEMTIEEVNAIRPDSVVKVRLLDGLLTVGQVVYATIDHVAIEVPDEPHLTYAESVTADGTWIEC